MYFAFLRGSLELVISIFVTKPSPSQAVTVWYGIDSDKRASDAVEGQNDALLKTSLNVFWRVAF